MKASRHRLRFTRDSCRAGRKHASLSADAGWTIFDFYHATKKPGLTFAARRVGQGMPALFYSPCISPGKSADSGRFYRLLSFILR